MATRTRNPRGEGERLRVTLLDVATELLAEVKDIDALSVRAVTARAGVSPTALYMHFADKDELVTAIKGRCFAALGARLDLAGDTRPDTDPLAQLQAKGAAYLAFAREQPGWYAVCFRTNFRDETALAAPVDKSDESMQVFGGLVQAVTSVFGGDEERAFPVATILWAALHGRAMLLHAMPECPFPDEGEWLAALTVGLLGRDA